MKKNVKAFLVITIVIMLAANCKSKESQLSASDIAEIWHDIKTKLDTTDMTDSFLSEGIILQIDEFNNSLNLFINSPVGYLYLVNRKEDMRLLDITAAVDRLKAAVRSGSVREVFSNTIEIDGAVSLLQRVDAEFSGSSQLNNYLLFFFFTLLVIATTLIFTALQNKLNKEKLQHQQSLSFSRETMQAQEHERSRIAMELHDTVAQDLLRLSIQTEIIKKEAVSEKQSRLCAEVEEGHIELLSKIRSICDDLIPPDFQPSGGNCMEPPVPRLPDALCSLCRAFEKRTGIECNITINDDADFSFLDADKQLHCFRIVQECLANVEKHAKADEVSVFVRGNSEGELIFFVTDNGKGFEGMDKDFSRAMRAKGHFGMWNMQERADSMNAVFSVGSYTGEGTTVKLIIPPPYFKRGGVNYDFNCPYRRSHYADKRYRRAAGSDRTLYNRGLLCKS